MSRSRGWCFTINNPKDFDKERVVALKTSGCDYVICGEEVGQGGTPHLQGYVHFKEAKSLKSLSKLLPRARLEAAKGTGSQNRDYCVKEGVILTEWGTMPQDPVAQGVHGAKGAKSGVEYWEKLKAAAKTGDLEALDAKTFVTQYRTVKAIQKDYSEKKEPLAETTGEWWWGPSGSGKSRTARETYPQAYIKGVNKWWDGYNGEDVVIIEDLDKFNVALGGDLKRWCDHYSFPAEVKGGGMNIRPKKIIITSQYDINEIWEDNATVAALERRCKKRVFEVPNKN